MTTLRDAAQQALEALESAIPWIVTDRNTFAEVVRARHFQREDTETDESILSGYDAVIDDAEKATTALRAALAEPAEQEAVAPQQQQQQQLKRTHPLDVPLEVFLADLTTRPANVIRLELTGLFDGEPLAVRHLCMFSRKEMKRWPNFGKKCLNEVEELLRARGLRLWESHDERSLRLLHEHKEYFL